MVNLITVDFLKFKFKESKKINQRFREDINNTASKD